MIGDVELFIVYWIARLIQTIEFIWSIVATQTLT